MQITSEHFSQQSALLEFTEKADGSFLFHCRDGEIEVKSTLIKLHSKLINQMIADVPSDETEVPTQFVTTKYQ